MIRSLLILALLAFSQSFGTFHSVIFPKNSGAFCLDGTPGGIYYFEPDVKGPNKLLIYFEDTPTGWCYQGDIASSIAHCYGWRTTDHGSSKDYGG